MTVTELILVAEIPDKIVGYLVPFFLLVPLIRISNEPHVRKHQPYSPCRNLAIYFQYTLK